MPTYKFKNNQTGEEWDEFFTSSSAKDELLKEYPHVQQVPTSLELFQQQEQLMERLSWLERGFIKFEDIQIVHLQKDMEESLSRM